MPRVPKWLLAVGVMLLALLFLANLAALPAWQRLFAAADDSAVQALYDRALTAQRRGDSAHALRLMLQLTDSYPRSARHDDALLAAAELWEDAHCAYLPAITAYDRLLAAAPDGLHAIAARQRRDALAAVVAADVAGHEHLAAIAQAAHAGNNPRPALIAYCAAHGEDPAAITARLWLAELHAADAARHAAAGGHDEAAAELQQTRDLLTVAACYPMADLTRDRLQAISNDLTRTR